MVSAFDPQRSATSIPASMRNQPILCPRVLMSAPPSARVIARRRAKLKLFTGRLLNQAPSHNIISMLAKRIIPCLDVMAGRVVKGTRFIALRDAGDPVECAKEYDRQAADELCFLDITASQEDRPIILEVVARTAEEVLMPLTVGGGVRALDDIRRLLPAGADKDRKSVV